VAARANVNAVDRDGRCERIGYGRYRAKR